MMSSLIDAHTPVAADQVSAADDSTVRDEPTSTEGPPSPFPAADVPAAALRSVAVLAVLVAAVRYLFTVQVRIFALSPDELAYAGVSRFLAGGHWDMLRTNTWRPGYSAVLAPLSAVVDDPVTWIRIAFAINAVAAGATVFLLVPLVRRLTLLGPRATLVVAGVIALSPASLSASAHIWPEPFVTLCFLGVLWSLMRLLDDHRAVHGLVAVLVSVVGYTFHGRMLPVVGVTTLLAGVAFARRRRWLPAAGTVVVAGAGVLASNAYANWVYREVWTATADTNSTSGVLRRLVHPLQVFDAAFGQIWYQLCASALVFGVGVVALIWTATRRTVDRRRRTDAWLVLGLTVPMVMMSVAFMSDRARADHVIYGRYTDAIAWPVLAFGVGWLLEGSRAASPKLRRWTYIGVPVLLVDVALMVRQLHYRQLRSGTVVIDMVPGFMPALDGTGKVPVLTMTAVALVLFMSLLLAVRRLSARPELLAGLVVAATAAAAAAAYINFPSRENNWARAESIVPFVHDNIPAGTTIGISLMPDQYSPSATMFQQISYGLLYQWYLPDYRFEIDGGLQDDIGPWVIAPGNDLIMNLGCGTFLWEQEYGGLGVWHDPKPGATCDQPDVPGPPSPSD